MHLLTIFSAMINSIVKVFSSTNSINFAGTSNSRYSWANNHKIVKKRYLGTLDLAAENDFIKFAHMA